MFFKDNHTYWVKGNALIGGSVLSNGVFTVTDSKINGIYPIFSNTVVGVDKLYEIDKLLEPDDVVNIVDGSSGLWLDPSQRSALFQDAAGTIPATAPGQPVGLIRDLSGHGNHASQSAALSRPILGRHPASGLRNLLTRTEQFDNAVWLKSAQGNGAVPTVTTNAGLAPDGSMTAARVQFSRLTNALPNRSQLRYSITMGNDNTTSSIWMRSFSGVNQNIAIANSQANLGNKNFLVTGEWQRFDIQSTSIIATGSQNFWVGLHDALSPNLTADVLIWGAQFEVGSTATPYQRVTTQYDVTEAGKRDLWYLSFNGTNQWMQTGAFAWGSDKATICAGLLGGASAQILLEFSQGVSGNPGSFYVSAPENSGIAYASLSRGSAPVSAQQRADIVTGTAPDTAVISATHDIAGDLSTIRRNGVSGVNATGDKGAGNFLTYPIYIGARAGTSLFFKGRIYGLMAINRVLSPSELALVEAYFASCAGVSLA